MSTKYDSLVEKLLHELAYIGGSSEEQIEDNDSNSHEDECSTIERDLRTCAAKCGVEDFIVTFKDEIKKMSEYFAENSDDVVFNGIEHTHHEMREEEAENGEVEELECDLDDYSVNVTCNRDGSSYDYTILFTIDNLTDDRNVEITA